MKIISIVKIGVQYLKICYNTIKISDTRSAKRKGSVKHEKTSYEIEKKNVVDWRIILMYKYVHAPGRGSAEKPMGYKVRQTLLYECKRKKGSGSAKDQGEILFFR